jgi:ADP-glucose pyrophosphorylase
MTEFAALCRLKCLDTRDVIFDKRCCIPSGMVIGDDLSFDRDRFHVTENGVVLVTPAMLGQRYHATPPHVQQKQLNFA